MECPGTHCDGCGSGGGKVLLMACGAVAGGIIFAAYEIDRALHAASAAATPVLTAVVPYIVGAGIPIMAGIFGAVAVIWRREQARTAWLATYPYVTGNIIDQAALPARSQPVAAIERPAWPQAPGLTWPGSIDLSAALDWPGQVDLSGLALPADHVR